MNINTENRRLFKKAENLVSLAKLTAIGSQISALSLFPQLKASELKSWEFFCTVLATWSALLKIKSYVKDANLVLQLQEIVLTKLEKFHPQGRAAYDDFDNFLFNHFKDKNENAVNQETVKALAGTWLLWNLTNKKPIEDERRIISVLGEMFFIGFAFYWEDNEKEDINEPNLQKIERPKISTPEEIERNIKERRKKKNIIGK